MANIRDQCSWVHATHMPEATDKAKDLVRMAVARVATLRPLHDKRITVVDKALVIGGGISGMLSALDLANSGYYVYLVEKGPSIGGVMAQLDKTFPTNDCAM
jgi:heterodisulfide reductase subunit A